MSEQQAPKGPSKAPVKIKSAGEAQAPKAQAPATSESCKFETCKKKNEKFGFCMEHYDLYMAGVIRGDGKKPIDYSQKLAQHLSRHKKAAA